MENAKPVFIGVIAIVVVIGLFALYKNMQSNGGGEMATTTPTGTEIGLETINAKHLFADGTHTYHGVIVTPTPCYDVTASASSADNGASYDIAITSKDRGGICAQVLTDKDFEVSFKAGADIPVYVTLNGKPAQFNVIEVTTPEELRGPFDFKS